MRQHICLIAVVASLVIGDVVEDQGLTHVKVTELNSTRRLSTQNDTVIFSWINQGDETEPEWK